MVNNYIFTGDYNNAKENIHFLEKYISASDSSHASDVYAMYGMMYGVRAIYDSCIMFYDKAIKLNERYHNYSELPANYANIAIGYQQQANYPMALKYQQKGLSLAQKTGNESIEAKTFLNMGITYQHIGDTAKAIQYYLQAKDLAIKLHSTHIELYVYTNLASVYIAKHEWEKAYDLAIKAAELAGHTGDIGIQATCMSQAVISLAYQNRFEEATRLSKQSIILADSSTQPLNIAQANNAMGVTLFLQKKYKEAIPYFEKTFQKLKGSSSYDFAFADSYKGLSKCYEETGNYKKALENYQIGVSVLDSMRKKDNIRKATELSMNYDFAVAEKLRQAPREIGTGSPDIHYEPTVSVSTVQSGNNVIITVSDNGNGIPQSIADKIFQPFFTTKPTGQGTGLGLSLSYDIVKAHGGEIKVETKVEEGNRGSYGKGGGTTFTIELPVV